MPCAPRISRWKIAAIGPVMGSLSLNATSMGVGLTDSLAHATGLKTESLLMMQAVGFATVLLPYQGPPIVVGLQLAGERLSSAAKICVPLALITIFVLLPFNYFWWKMLDWL